MALDKRASFIAVSHEFSSGILKWLEHKKIDLENVVEVGAGSGLLGKTHLNLNDDNVTDNYNWQGSNLENDDDWVNAALAVKQEDAIITIKDREVTILIMGMPEEGPDALQSAIALNAYHPDALILYIGTDGSSNGTVADDDFFEHMYIVEDDKFDKYVIGNYPTETTKFQQQYIPHLAGDIVPILYKFKKCDEQDCNCSYFVKD